MKLTVYGCDTCPFLYQNGEFPESRCTAISRGWGMGYHKHGDPTPDWCPLKKAQCHVRLAKPEEISQRNEKRRMADLFRGFDRIVP